MLRDGELNFFLSGIERDKREGDRKKEREREGGGGSDRERIKGMWRK